MYKHLSLISTWLVISSLLASGMQAAPLWAQEPAAKTPAQRWIVQLQEPSLSTAPNMTSEYAILSEQPASQNKLDLSSTAAIRYRAFLQERQQSVLQAIKQVIPMAQVHQTYQIVFNGMSVATPSGDEATREKLRALPGVAAVFREQSHELQLYASLPTMNTAAIWNNPSIGGQSHAGAGIKIAIIDAGIEINNPLFNPAGFSYPPGYPKGNTAHTTPKVIVSRAYFRPDLPPLPGSETPEPGPKDSSHGTHVAGIAAGNANTIATISGMQQPISGVAPRAYLMNYKAFYENESVFTGMSFDTELMLAIEDAVADGADVINNSWGGRDATDPRFEPLSIAANGAAQAGVVMVFSTGNSGPSKSTTDSRDYTNKLIMVGATTTNKTIAAGFVDVTAPSNMPETVKQRPYAASAFGQPIKDKTFGPTPYVPIETLGVSSLGCDPPPADSLTGKIALIERGICHFSIKVLNAQKAGAVAAIVYNSQEGGEKFIAMGPGDGASEVTIPSIFVQHSTGKNLIEWHKQHPDVAQLQIDPKARILDEIPDVLAPFSSLGPTFQNSLKPDVVAPGVNILSAGFASSGEKHMGFGLASGTSMAAPHIAGACALLKQAHPNWTPADIKSALMSTANTQVWVDDKQTEPAGVLMRGAGRVDLGRAVDPGVVFSPPSLSFGSLANAQPTHAEITVAVRNVTNAPQTYELSAKQTDGKGNVTINLSRSTLIIEAGAQTQFTVSVDLPAGIAPGDYEGEVALYGSRDLHLPLWVRAKPAEQSSTVLLIDNDGSSSLELPNYANYYTNALKELGITYTYLDVDTQTDKKQTLPDIEELQTYRVMMWFTGDNDVFSSKLPVPTPLTEADQNLLIAYLQNGGNLIASGQNLAEASDIESVPEDPQYGRSDIYKYYLGAGFLQENIFEGVGGTKPIVTGTGQQPWLSAIRLNLNNPADDGKQAAYATSAGNQYSIDEINILNMDPRSPDKYTNAILTVASPNRKEDGIVGLNRYTEPSLEKPITAFAYRTTYLSFGFESIRDDTGTMSKKEFLQTLLNWHLGRPWVEIDRPISVGQSNQTMQITARATSNVPANFVRYRWDFGDGTPFVETKEPVVTHQYAQPGAYLARVEVTDHWGHRAVSEGPAREDPGKVLQDETTKPAPVPPSPIAKNTLTFSETGKTIQGRFLEYWQQNGGLPIFGYPISNQGTGNPLTQSFERVRFEYHPENAPPYDILLSHMGAEALKQQGRDWHSFPTVEAVPPDCLFFAETQHSLCGPFKTYWQNHGLQFDGKQAITFAESLALFGLPLSEPQQETIEGKTVLVQWFERARFEQHTDMPSSPILLGRLGSELFNATP